jgi:ubiquinone/menaquinone biosynthesis C-methylase UbiE
MIKVEYFGISPLEIEVIYNILSKFSFVEENKILVEESKYVSLLNIEFPVPYDEYFFQSFGFDNWQKIKDLFNEMKRRRGRKGFKIILSFCGISTEINSKLVFSLTSEIGPQFEYAIEKIEHVIDAIHLEIKNLESKRQIMSYTYDAIAMKWILSDII